MARAGCSSAVASNSGFEPVLRPTDTRGDGGYFIAAGSVRSDGSKYEWDCCPDEAAEAPSTARAQTFAPKAFAEHPDCDGISKKRFSDAMGRLLKAKRIRLDVYGPPSKLRTKLVVVEPDTAEPDAEAQADTCSSTDSAAYPAYSEPD